MTTVQPFTIHVSDEVLADLHERLAHTRWPGELPGTAWNYGSNLTYEVSTLPASRTSGPTL